MLWSPTQQKIYSVGKDRYDDGGRVEFRYQRTCYCCSHTRTQGIAGICSNQPN